MLRKIRSSRAFTLVELMIVVAIIGLLAALAIYGVRRYMTNSKTAEARQALGAISKGARAAFDGEVWSDTGVIAAGSSRAGAAGQLCGDAAPIPAEVPEGEKYQSTDADWDDDAGWSCLRFSISGPQYFQYDYTNTANTAFTATAAAKLGGASDETLTLSLNGAVQGSTVTIAPTINETKGDEAGGGDDGGDDGGTADDS